MPGNVFPLYEDVLTIFRDVPPDTNLTERIQQALDCEAEAERRMLELARTTTVTIATDNGPTLGEMLATMDADLFFHPTNPYGFEDLDDRE